MLTGKGKHEDDEGPSPVQGYLVECVTSATSILAIFDLFCRTFSMNYCVLSLAYCVYIAASIFLLQVQANPDDNQAMRKLTYCIQCLHQVKQISPGKSASTIYVWQWVPHASQARIAPVLLILVGYLIVIASALNNITKELSAIGIGLGASPQPQPQSHPPTSTTPRPDIPGGPSMYHTSPDMPRQVPLTNHPVFQPALGHNFGPDPMSMEPGVFETMSTLEPLSTRVGGMPGSHNPSGFR